MIKYYVINDKELMKDWNWEKNNALGLLPNKLTCSSKKRVWWKCSKCNYEYERQIRNRTQRNHSCPKCSVKGSTSVNLGVNDLKSQNPRIAKEWNYNRNGKLKPEDVTINSGKKVWWICPTDHEYQAIIRDRNSGTGCPICMRARSTSFPEQAIFYYIKKVFPEAINKYKDVFKNSMELDVYIPSLKVGIEYDGKNWHKTEDEHRREIKKYHVCKQNNIYLIRLKEEGSNLWNDTADSIHVLCKPKDKILLGRYIHYILSMIDADVGRIFGNQIFYNKVSVDIERDKTEILSYLSKTNNSIAELYPNLVKEWNYKKNGNLRPEMFTAGSNEKVWWKCSKCDFEWQVQINGRTPPKSSGCPKCAIIQHGKTFHDNYLIKHGSILETNPKLTEEFHSTKNKISVYEITEYSNKKVWWLCKKCGYEWTATPNNRSKGVGCPCCSGRVPKIGINDLKTIYPSLAKEWDYKRNGDLKPEMFKPGSGKTVWWICENCFNEWEAVIRNRVKGINKCPNCKKNGKKD